MSLKHIFLHSHFRFNPSRIMRKRLYAINFFPCMPFVEIIHFAEHDSTLKTVNNMNFHWKWKRTSWTCKKNVSSRYYILFSILPIQAINIWWPFSIISFWISGIFFPSGSMFSSIFYLLLRYVRCMIREQWCTWWEIAVI